MPLEDLGELCPSVDAGKAAPENRERPDFLRIFPCELPEMALRLFERRIFDGDPSRLFPVCPARFCAQYFHTAGLSHDLHHHVERAVLMHGIRIVVFDRGREALVPVGNHALYGDTPLPETIQDAVIASSEFVAREEDPRQGLHLLRIKGEIPGVHPAFDPQMLRIEHEDGDFFRQAEAREDACPHARIFGALHPPPRGRGAHLPALTQPCERGAVEKIAREPTRIPLATFLPETRRLPAFPAMYSFLSVPMSIAAAAERAAGSLFL